MAMAPEKGTRRLWEQRQGLLVQLLGKEVVVVVDGIECSILVPYRWCLNRVFRIG